MLVNFKFKNCRSFLNEANLSLEATTDKEYRELNTFFVDEKITGKGNNELLKSAIIFGANATGKSNVLKALKYMRDVVLDTKQSDFLVLNNKPFLLNESAPNEESLYEVDIIQNNIFYRYGFTILKGKIKREWLYKRFERLTLIFEREDNVVLKIKGETPQAASFVNAPSTCLFLSFANLLHLKISETIKDVVDWFKNLEIVFSNDLKNLDKYDVQDGKYREEAIDILKGADIGIEDINYIKYNIDAFDEENEAMHFDGDTKMNHSYAQQRNTKTEATSIDLQTTFNVYNDKYEVVSQRHVSIFNEPDFYSEGTIRMIYYLGIVLSALDKGQVLIIDELDTKFHFIISECILELFNSIAGNYNNAQLICNAHDISLMDKNIRRDQIYFTIKNKYGESTMLSLADYKNVRKDISYSRKYSAGFYTDIPDIFQW